VSSQRYVDDLSVDVLIAGVFALSMMVVWFLLIVVAMLRFAQEATALVSM
jgi:hypothetical protein